MITLPYVTAHGNIKKAFEAIKLAPVPDKVSQDFVKTVLKVKGGSGSQVTRYLKQINFATSDGTPTQLYKKFRNSETSGQCVAEAIRHAYKPLYDHNEFMYQLDDKKLQDLIIEVTGHARDSNPVKLTFSCIKALKSYADFEAKEELTKEIIESPEKEEMIPSQVSTVDSTSPSQPDQLGLNLGYTINLNLPATSDPAVFNAIFKSLKEHLLRNDDA